MLPIANYACWSTTLSLLDRYFAIHHHQWRPVYINNKKAVDLHMASVTKHQAIPADRRYLHLSNTILIISSYNVLRSMVSSYVVHQCTHDIILCSPSVYSLYHLMYSISVLMTSSYVLHQRTHDIILCSPSTYS